jgi:glycosyltransferase involved in cell wall biosynthesis
VTYVVSHVKDEERGGVKIRAVPPVKSRALRMLLTTTRVALKVLRTRAEAYHFHDPELLPVGVLLKLLRRRVIYDSHEDMPLAITSKPYLPLPLRRPISRAYAMFENWCARRFDAVVTATSSIAARFERIGTRTLVVTNYPQLRDFPPPPPEETEREDAVCYIGGISRTRGLLEMIDAVELAGVRLLLAGDLSSRELRAEAMARPGWKRVEELGVIDRAGTVEVMQRSFAGLVVLYPEPNHVESLPIKMFEYMSAGLPVIASDFPLWREIVDQARLGFVVDPHDPVQIAEAIRKLRDDPKGTREMGIRGRRAVEEIYNWSPQYVKLRALYVDITGAPPAEGNP